VLEQRKRENSAPWREVKEALIMRKNTVPQIQPATRKEHFEMAEKPQWKMALSCA